MKKCPYCSEEIQSEAIKCRYCGEWFDEQPLTDDSDERTTSQEKLQGQDYGQYHETPKKESPPLSSPQQKTVATAPIGKVERSQLEKEYKNAEKWLIEKERYRRLSEEAGESRKDKIDAQSDFGGSQRSNDNMRNAKEHYNIG